MIALLELVFFLFFLPYILFGVVLAKIWDAVHTLFQPAILLVAVWIALLGLFLLYNMAPKDRSWLTTVESVAQSYVFGISTPYAILGISVCALVVSVLARERSPVAKRS